MLVLGRAGELVCIVIWIEFQLTEVSDQRGIDATPLVRPSRHTDAENGLDGCIITHRQHSLLNFSNKRL